MMEPAMRFWRGLSPREQWIMGGGVALLAVVLLIFYVWQPLEKGRARLRAELPKLRAEARLVRAEAAETARLKGGRKAPAMAGLREAVEQSAAAHGLQLAQAVPEGNGRLNVTFAAASFDGWVKWLAAMSGQAIRLESCRVEALPQPGMVKVQAVLSR